MQLQKDLDQSRYNMASSSMRNNPKLAETTSTAFYSTGFNSTKGSASFRMRRTSSFTTSNVRNKLDICETSLNILADELASVRKQTRESRQFAQSLTEQLNSNLYQKNKKLHLNIVGLKNHMEKQKDAERERIQNIKHRCSQLCDSTTDIKNHFENLKARLEQVERVMGFYGGHEKYRS